MLNKNEILKEIKRLMTFNATTTNFIDAKAGDMILRVEGETFEIGSDLTVVTEEGVIPAPDGEHTLDDGRVITTSAGVITDILLPENLEEDNEVVEVEMAEITPEEEKQEKESVMKKMGEAEKKIEEMEKKIMDMEEIVKEMVKAYGKVGEFSKSVETKIDNFIKNTPAEQHFSSLKSEWKSKIKENKTTELSSLDRINQLRKKQ